MPGYSDLLPQNVIVFLSATTSMGAGGCGLEFGERIGERLGLEEREDAVVSPLMVGSTARLGGEDGWYHMLLCLREREWGSN
ncbi:hypothetical protein Acr_00g0049660 [Actinidia rufa]|uniref:Uncharacterized protein n=1 Tax=Actinidia rufa TaxID=165716 RepID=A0A7J0DKK8_9ERIC|nr:hypothetical protein Acr_00g0049660 [Actinidia rufa]